MQQHGSKYLPAESSLTLGSIGQNSSFSEHGHVAYRIKGNHQMQQHGSKYLAVDSYLTLLLGSKVNFFMVMLHIKLKGITKWGWRNEIYFS